MLTAVDEAKSALSRNSELGEKESLKYTGHYNTNYNTYNTDDCNRYYRQEIIKNTQPRVRKEYYVLGGEPWKAFQRKWPLS